MNINEALSWFAEDPVGRMVALGAIVVVGLIALLFTLRSMRWAAARWKSLFAVAVVLALMFYGGVALFNLGPGGWIVGGIIAFGAFVGFALTMTRA